MEINVPNWLVYLLIGLVALLAILALVVKFGGIGKNEALAFLGRLGWMNPWV